MDLEVKDMIELNINRETYDETIESTPEFSTDSANTSTTPMASREDTEIESDIFALARNIATRSYRYRSIRRSTSII